MKSLSEAFWCVEKLTSLLRVTPYDSDLKLDSLLGKMQLKKLLRIHKQICLLTCSVLHYLVFCWFWYDLKFTCWTNYSFRSVKKQQSRRPPIQLYEIDLDVVIGNKTNELKKNVENVEYEIDQIDWRRRSSSGAKVTEYSNEYSVGKKAYKLFSVKKLFCHLPSRLFRLFLLLFILMEECFHRLHQKENFSQLRVSKPNLESLLILRKFKWK